MNIEDVIGFEALYESMNKCIKQVLWKDSVAFFYHNWLREISKLEKELHNGTYKERKAKYFTVTEPKEREIMSIAFRDRVYQRSLNDVAIYPEVSRHFIYDNMACQRGKGTHKARERLKCFMQKYYRRHGSEGYVLQCDVKGYYPHMRHDIAKMVFKKYLDDNIYKMAADIIDNFPGEAGFNPGSQIIQIVGIAALNRMDHYIKEQLKIKYYIRYMDDFVLIHEDKETLKKCLACISKILKSLGMSLNVKKTKIRKLKEKTLFLGFQFRLTDTGKVIINIDPHRVKHERKKLRRMVNLVKKGKKKKGCVDEHFRSWKVHASYGNSYKMIQRMNQYYKELWED